MEIMEKILKDTQMHYYSTNMVGGESILFVHAAFADHTMFDDQLSFFANKYQVITLDLIGHGQSTKTNKGDNINNTADYINLIMATESIEKLHLVGVSIGAILIQDFANKYPDKVASLCCIGGYDINNFDSNLQKGNSKEQLKLMLKAIFSIKWFAQSNKLISAATPIAQEKFYQMNIKFKKSSFRYLSALSKLVNQNKTSEREYPLLIGCGSLDNQIAIKAAKMWHESERNSRFVIFEKAGHLVNMDVPQEFNDVLIDHLNNRV